MRKENVFCHGNWPRYVTAHQGNVFILTQLGRFFIHRIDSKGQIRWIVHKPVEDFANFPYHTVRCNGYYRSRFAHEGKVNVLLSGSRKGKLDGEFGAILGVEDMEFVGPVSYGRGLIYFSYCHRNGIFALIPNTNEKQLLLKLPDAPYKLSHMDARRTPQPPK